MSKDANLYINIIYDGKVQWRNLRLFDLCTHKYPAEIIEFDEDMEPIGFIDGVEFYITHKVVGDKR